MSCATKAEKRGSMSTKVSPWATEALNIAAIYPAGTAVSWSNVRMAFAEDREITRFLAGLDHPEHRRAIGITFARMGKEAARKVIAAGMMASS